MFSRAKVTADLVRAQRAFGSAKRGRVRLPLQQPPKMLEREYARELVALVVPRIRAALGPLLAALPGLLAAAAAERKRGDRMDAGEGKRVRQLLDAAREQMKSSISLGQIEKLAEKFAARTSTYQRIQLGRQTKAALGVDVFASDKRLPPLFEAFVDANVGLVRDIGDKIAAKMELEITRGVQDGMLHGDLAEKLEAIGFGEQRAALIARDQVGKLYGQINATRQSELGVDRFIWRSSGDERVRDLHDDLDGEEFSYADGGHPTEGLPGEPIMCRCWAEPVFAPVLDEVEPVAEIEPEKVEARAPRAPRRASRATVL